MSVNYSNDNCQKIKLLKLMDILLAETDEEHPLSTSRLCSKLAENNISCNPKTLSKDIKTLNEQGYEVMSTMVGHEKGYYIEDRNFSVPELKILIDAVQAASFITSKKSTELISKIADLAGMHRAKELKSNFVCFNTRKHKNECVFYSVDSLHNALKEHKMVSFYYFDINEHGDKVYRKNKERYIVEPLALVFSEDNYYLMCYSSKYNNICNYRVDRMEYVDVLDESVSPNAIIDESDIGEYTEQVFRMYGGTPIEVQIEFDLSLLGAVYDKFGEDTRVWEVGEKMLSSRIKVQVSPTFFGWLFQFGSKMKVVSPESVIHDLKNHLNEFSTTL